MRRRPSFGMATDVASGRVASTLAICMVPTPFCTGAMYVAGNGAAMSEKVTLGELNASFEIESAWSARLSRFRQFRRWLEDLKPRGECKAQSTGCQPIFKKGHRGTSPNSKRLGA